MITRRGLLNIGLAFEALAADRNVVVKVVVGQPRDRIAKITLGGIACRVISMDSAQSLPSIVVLLGDFLIREREDAGIGEIKPLLRSKQALGTVEFWSQLGTGRYEVYAPFRNGFVSFPRDGPFGEKSYPGVRLAYDETTVIELVARRFAFRGPAKLFIVTGGFDLDYRRNDKYYSGLYNETSLEPFWPTVGDSGIVVYPIVIPKPKLRPKSLVRKRDFSSGLFGTESITAGGAHGEALAEAFRISNESTVVEVEVPARKYTVFDRAPKLEVFAPNGERVFWRPFVAGGEPTDEAEASAKMALELSRIVDPLIIGKADIVAGCGGLISPEPGKRYVQLESVRFPREQPDSSSVLVSLTPKLDPKSRLIERGHSATLRRVGERWCVGPLDIFGDSEIYIHDPVRLWLGAIRIGKLNR